MLLLVFSVLTALRGLKATPCSGTHQVVFVPLNGGCTRHRSSTMREIVREVHSITRAGRIRRAWRPTQASLKDAKVHLIHVSIMIEIGRRA